jgi:hypothetical protein
MDGNLDPSVVPEFEAFLKANPKLNYELHPDTIIPLISEQISFPDKQSLKKFDFDRSSVSMFTFEEFSIAYFERLLNQTKQKELLDFIEKKPEYAFDFDLYSKSYVIPQPESIFSNKKGLYRYQTKQNVFTIFKMATLAAGVALLFGIYIKSPKDVKSKINTTLTLDKKIISNSTAIKSSSETKPQQGKSVANQNFNGKVINTLSYIESSNPSIINEKTISTRNKTDTIQIMYLTPKKGLISHLEPESNTIIVKLNSKKLQTNENTEGITEYALIKIRKNLGLQKMEDSKGRLSFFKILQAGVNGFNELTESNIQLTEKTDESGKMMALSFKTESGIFQIHHKKGK